MSLNASFVNTGRSSSQVSIYNYPEHLNPFYEDDQHKRLRFWKLPSFRKNDDGKDSQRRNSSFSVNSLRDFWTSKSFRLKKRSSTLGINKTSESPPPLKRDFINNTLLHEGYNNGTKDLSFQRNNLYRSSLQNIQYYKKNDAGATNIQNNYLNTTASPRLGENYRQTASKRNMYCQSLTPQPNRNGNFSHIHSNGTATLRLRTNTNPFDEDDNVHDVSYNRGNRSTPATERKRIKRRAPEPPKNLGTPTKDDVSLTNCELRICEDQQDQTQDGLNIANLTEQIENLVKTVNEENSVAEKTSSVQVIVKTETEKETPQNAITNENTVAKQEEIAKEEIKVATTNANSKSNALNNTQTKEPKKENSKIIETIDVKDVSTDNVASVHTVRNNADIVTHTTARSPIVTKRTTTKYANDQYSLPKRNVEVVENTVTISELKNNTKAKSDPINEKPKIVKKPILPKEDNLSIKRLNIPQVKSSNNKLPLIKTNEHRNRDDLHIVHNDVSPNAEVECIHFHVESANKNMEPTVQSNMSTFKGLPNNAITTKTTFTLVNTPKKEIAAATLEQNKIAALKIIEKPENNSVAKPESPTVLRSKLNIEEPSVEQPTEQHILKTFQPTFAGTSYDPTYNNNHFLPRAAENATNQQSNLAESAVAKTKRRSVQSIIDSINESQRILNAAAHKNPTSPLVTRKLYEPATLNSFERSSSQQGNNLQLKSDNETDAQLNYTDSQKLNNIEAFKNYEQKKELNNYREASPTTLNLDWNPVPKPKRTKNLPECANLE